MTDNFGENLRLLRKQKKLSQAYVASAIGITVTAYGAYERRGVRPRRKEAYRKLAEILEVNEVELLFGTVDKDTDSESRELRAAIMHLVRDYTQSKATSEERLALVKEIVDAMTES